MYLHCRLDYCREWPNFRSEFNTKLGDSSLVIFVRFDNVLGVYKGVSEEAR